MIVSTYMGAIDNDGYFEFKQSSKDMKYSYSEGLYRFHLDPNYPTINVDDESIFVDLLNATLGFNAEPPDQTKQQGFWTERHMHVAMSAALFHYKLTHDETSKNRLYNLLIGCLDLLQSEWGLLHNIWHHEAWRESPDPLYVTSPWMMSLLVHTLRIVRDTFPEWEDDINQIIVESGKGIAFNGMYQAENVHPEVDGRWFVPYLIGPDGKYHDGGPWKDVHHSLDVIPPVVAALQIDDDSRLKEAADNLLETAKWWLTDKWQTMPTIRHYNWTFGTTLWMPEIMKAYVAPSELQDPPIEPEEPVQTHLDIEIAYEIETVTLIKPDGQMWNFQLENTEPIPDPEPEPEPEPTPIPQPTDSLPKPNFGVGTVIPGTEVISTWGRPWVGTPLDWFERFETGNLVVPVWDHNNTANALWYDLDAEQLINRPWPFGDTMPNVLWLNNRHYFVAVDNEHPDAYGQVFYDSVGAFEKIKIDMEFKQEALSKAHKIFDHQKYVDLLGWPDGVPTPEPGKWQMARYRDRCILDSGAELVRFCGDNADPVTYFLYPNGSIESHSGYWHSFDGTYFIRLDTWAKDHSVSRGKDTREPWDWDGVTRKIENVMIFYSFHKDTDGVFWQDPADGKWKEVFSSQWGHPYNINWTLARIFLHQGKLKQVSVGQSGLVLREQV